MTKIDYELIARILHDSVYSEPGILCEAWEHMDEQYNELVQEFAHELAQDNSKFDRNKFLQACGVTQ
jgi:hypothetical protein